MEDFDGNSSSGDWWTRFWNYMRGYSFGSGVWRTFRVKIGRGEKVLLEGCAIYLVDTIRIMQTQVESAKYLCNGAGPNWGFIEVFKNLRERSLENTL